MLQRRLIPTITVVAVLALAACSDSDKSVVSDFGDAVAVSQVDDVGDLETLLLAADDGRVLGSIYIDAGTGAIDMSLGERDVPFRGSSPAGRDLAEVNELLFAVYEIDIQTVSLSSCAGNAFATCCLASPGWSCEAQ